MEKKYNIQTHVSFLKSCGLILLLWLSFDIANAQNNALDFDGTNDYVATPLNRNAISDYTIEAWFKYEGTVGDGYIPIIASNTVDFFIGKNSGDANFGIQDNQFFGGITTNAFDGNWHHIAVTRLNSSNTITLYVDGVNIYSSSGFFTGAGTGTLNIGYEPEAAGFYFNGGIDEVRIWNAVRTCSEIKANMNNELTGSEPGLVAYYNFNQGTAGGNNGSETTLNDGAGSNNGTLNGYATTGGIDLDGGSTSNWVDGSANGVSGTTPTPQPEINVEGNSVPIADGDATPDVADATDFGNVADGASKIVTYTIQNTGTSVLTVSSIVSSGTNSVDFVVSNVPTSVAASSSATFTVTFTPSSLGAKTATITINNDDCDEAVYDFVVQGLGSVNNALDFDGTNDYVATPLNRNAISDYTIEAWFKYEGTVGAGYTPIIASNTADFFIGKNTGDANFGIQDNQFFGGITTNAFDGNWHHIAVTRLNSSNTITLYVDGVNIYSSSGFFTGAGAGTLNIGYEPEAAGFYFNGGIDEVRIWNAVRTCSDINANMNNELTGSEPGLVAYYNFNQGTAGGNNGSETTLNDGAGSNNGTLNGYATTGGIDLDGGSTSNWVTGSTGITSATPAPQPEINVEGNSVPIADGDATPDVADDTDFGNVANETSKIVTYTIQNTGTSALTVSSIVSSGTNNADFVVTSVPASVAASSSATFVVIFTPSSLGAKTATITINNDDCDEAVYDFAVQGTSMTPSTATWNGAAWSPSDPTISDNAIIDGDYSGPFFSCANLTVNATRTLTISSGTSVTVAGDVANSGTILVQNNGAFVQVKTTPTNSGTGTYTIERLAPDNHAQYNYWSSPVQNTNINAVFGSTGRRFYNWTASDTWANSDINATLTPGVGFIATGTSNPATTITRNFTDNTGFNSGDITFNLVYDAAGTDDDWNLVGNPYPSGINAGAFITDNSAIDAVYLWNSDGSDFTSAATDYATINNAGTVTSNGGGTAISATISSGQGFMVSATAASTLTFSNSQRIATNNNFVRTKADWQRIWLGVERTENSAKNEVLVAFIPEATEGKDSYDAKKFSANGFVSLYSIGENFKSGEKLAIQGLPTLEDGRIVPLGIKAKEAGEFSFGINNLDNFSESYEIYLHDAQNDALTDLRKGNYAVNLEEGELNERFSLRFIDAKVTSIEDDLALKGISLYSTGKQIQIQFADLQSAEANIAVYDLQGRQLFTKSTEGQTQISLDLPLQGIFIVKVENARGVITKKVYLD